MSSFVFDISVEKIRCIEAMQNYVNIAYLNVDGEFLERMERATLKSILDKELGGSVVRCHRSYIVNKTAISSISGNSQGLLISLKNCDKKIPVSRSYVSIFRDSRR